jgi:hypothetical protein
MKNTSGDLFFVSSGIETMRMKSGNVGIGTLSPGANLEVSGALLAPAEVRVNNVGGTWSVGDEIGRYSFYSTDASGLGARELGSIRGMATQNGTTGSCDLAFYTSVYNGASAERIRIGKNGGLILNNRKSMFYQYNQYNLGLGLDHIILAPNGTDWMDYFVGNTLMEITVSTGGTGTTSAWCKYMYYKNSTTGYTLEHVAGNSGASSNRPYMVHNNGNPVWRMNHAGGYTVSVMITTSSKYTY